MKKVFAFLTAIVLFAGSYVRADEGMWLLSLLQELNIKKMQEMGCKLSAEDIYSVNKSSLKDAVVIFGRGCTGEIVSNQGLLLTNHHCGFDAIQYHSSVEHDYLTNGFWAKNKDEELTVPDLTVTFLVRIEDVTGKILPQLNDKMKESERDTAVNQISRKLQAEAVQGTGYDAKVVNFFGGNNYYMFVYETYTDVRLVGAPPSSIGKFGGDTDNWMWPRHTGDFSVFRVYSGPDGKPAPYSKNNIPLHPKYHLPVSMKGVEQNDYTMILGYPGSTDRYCTSYKLKETVDIENAERIKIRGVRQDILMKDMKADPVIRIKYADKYSTSTNYWKYSIGQNKAIETLDVLDKKEALEDTFTNWFSRSAELKDKYGRALPLIKDAVESRKYYEQALEYISEALLQGAEITKLPLESFQLYSSLKMQPDSLQKISKLADELRKEARKFYKDYNAPTDEKVCVAMFKLYYDNVNEGIRPAFFFAIHGKKYKGNYEKYVKRLFDESIFADSVKLMKFLQKPTAKGLEKDMAFAIAISMAQTYWGIMDLMGGMESDYSKGNRMFIAGLEEMQKNRIFYPDANSTMRLTYGTVGGYHAKDAVYYSYYTTLKGVMEKEDTTNTEFIVPAKLKTLYRDKNYGPYGKDGEMRVCFITNTDITGGNSGSPVMNGNGELVGLAFDGNWEAMSGDIIYEPKLQKTICVDIRYIMFIMDKYAGAKYLVDEMTLRN